ncbi:MAG: Fic family protein [Bdellovibrionales bacterium]
MLDTYLTHPWINFRLDLSRATPSLWMALGEVKSKCEHLAGVPLKPAVAQELHRLYLTRGALASVAIEGNTLSEKQARAVLNKESNLPKSQKYLESEIDNILNACNCIMDDIEQGGARPLLSADLKSYNSYVLKNLAVDDAVVPGAFRQDAIAVSHVYIGPKWEEVEPLVDDLCVWLNGDAFIGVSDDPMIRSILKAIIGHLYVAWIHPFGDGNGRTARLLEFRFLLEGGVPSPAAHLLSNHYNKTRSEYYRQLDAASKSGGDLLPFIGYSLVGFVDQLHEQMMWVKHQQWMLAWETFVYEALGDGDKAASVRCKDLVFALTRHYGTYSKDQIHTLSPEVAKHYATKTAKTLSRDLHHLVELNLLGIENGKYYANTGLILSFLPRSGKGERKKQLIELYRLSQGEESKELPE